MTTKRLEAARNKCLRLFESLERDIPDWGISPNKIDLLEAIEELIVANLIEHKLLVDRT